MINRKYRVRVQHGEYIKEVSVFADEDEDTKIIKARAMKEFFRTFGPPLGMCYESQSILSWEGV